jgi:hypothetical protein
METRGSQEFGCLTSFSSSSGSTIYTDFFENTGDHPEGKNRVVDELFR